MEDKIEYEHVDIEEMSNAWRIAMFAKDDKKKREALNRIAAELPMLLTEVQGLRKELKTINARDVLAAMQGQPPQPPQLYVVCPSCGGGHYAPNSVGGVTTVTTTGTCTPTSTTGTPWPYGGGGGGGGYAYGSGGGCFGSVQKMPMIGP